MKSWPSLPKLGLGHWGQWIWIFNLEPIFRGASRLQLSGRATRRLRSYLTASINGTARNLISTICSRKGTGLLCCPTAGSIFQIHENSDPHFYSFDGSHLHRSACDVHFGTKVGPGFPRSREG